MTFDCSTTRPLAEASEAGHTFEPIFPGGAGIGATVTVRGPESAAVRTLLKRQLVEQAERDAASQVRGGRPPPPRTLEQFEADAVELAIAYTIAWSGFKDGDTPLEPTPQNQRRIYTQYSWIRRQVIDEAQDLGNFVRAGSTNSSPMPEPSSGST